MGNPVRRTKTRTRGVRGRFFSRKNDRLVRFESLNEKYLFKILETDSHVTSYCEQPLKIQYEFNDKEGIYTPDVLTEYIDGSKTIFEAKAQDELNKNEPRLEAKFQAARNYCVSHGWQFSVVTEAIRTSDAYMRADILWPHLMHPSLEIDRLSSLLDRVRDKECISLAELCPKLNWHDENYSYVLQLIGSGQLYESPYGVFDNKTIIGLFDE